MEFVILQQFNNYMDAHIVKARLEDGGVHCWLKDENLSTLIVDPIFTNAISGGIKLLVAGDDLQKAKDILNEPKQELNEDS